MGLFDRLKFWDPKALLRSTVEVTHESLILTIKRSPDKDLHFWLAQTYRNRPGYGKLDPMLPFIRTTVLSVCEPAKASVPLGCLIFVSEQPSLEHLVQPYFSEALAPAISHIVDGTFLSEWEKRNPWSASNVLGLRESIAATYNTCEDSGKNKLFAPYSPVQD